MSWLATVWSDTSRLEPPRQGIEKGVGYHFTHASLGSHAPSDFTRPAARSESSLDSQNVGNLFPPYRVADRRAPDYRFSNRREFLVVVRRIDVALPVVGSHNWPFIEHSVVAEMCTAPQA